MFDIGWSELLLIGVVALIFIGPKELPTVLRMVGQWLTKIRRMASDFQSQFHEAMREAEMAELKKQVDDLGNTTTSFTNFDPIGTVRKEIESAFDDKPKPATQVGTESVSTATPAAETPLAPPSPGVEQSVAPVASDPAPPPAPLSEPAAKDFAESMPAPRSEGSRA
jgi:sec-independent protein translocase protein TatB